MSKLFDYFVICGLDYSSGLEPDKFSEDNLLVSPLERSYKGKVLAHYPERSNTNHFDESAVCMFSLPAGLKFRTQKHSVTQAPNFHSFVITRENGSRCYGFSLIFYEEVKNKDICSAMQTLQAMYVTEQSSSLRANTMSMSQNQGPQSRSLPRYFKLSQNLGGAALTYYDISKDKLYVSKSIGLVSQTAYVQAAKTFLENLYRCVPKRSSGSNCLSLESYVFNLLFEVQIPSPGKSLLVHLPPSDPQMPPSSTIIQMPLPPFELPHLDYSLRLMFLWLGVEKVVQLFSCLLLEYQVLLRSTDSQRLMIVAEGITSLLFPFTWPHVYVPILPASLHHFLDAPVPFLMGLYASSESIKVASEANLCYVDIDKCKIQLPEEMAAFPHLEAFMTEIWATLDKYGVHVPNSEQNRGTQEIISKSNTLPGRPQNRRKLSIHDILDNDRPPSPPGSARSEALQRIADIVRRTGVALDPDEINQPSDSYVEDLRFNNSIREIFLNRFVHIFQSYENFVIFPNQTYFLDYYFKADYFNNISYESHQLVIKNRRNQISNVDVENQTVANSLTMVREMEKATVSSIFISQNKEDWFNNRDSMQNFDKASFLSDQPEHVRLFLWRFLESQMFATLIDAKILSSWGQLDANLLIFDNRIRLLRDRYGGENLLRSVSYEPCTAAHDSQRLIDRRLACPDFESPPPREVGGRAHPLGRAHLSGRAQFPILDEEVLNKTPVVNKGSIPRASALKKGLGLSKPPIGPQQRGGKVQDMSPALIAQDNWTFVEKLLKDCKAKTKRMLLAKLGAEGVTLSSNNANDSSGAVEESTLVTSLCDFLERVWAHGPQKKRGKSALWSYLCAYQEKHLLLGKKDNYVNEVSRLAANLENWNSHLSDARLNTELPDLPTSLSFDVANIQSMSDVKTAIGMARAWVRLALEKKQLSKHFRTLLSDHALLRAQYKRSAFLRCEEEREQFLYHLLSLNAVDYFCFTGTYLTTVIPYRILIVPNKKGTTSSANVWIVLSGTLLETNRISVPKSTLNFEYKHQNLGVLTTLRIGHDNTGLYAKWMIDYIIVRNEITGHTYKFPCGRWLGRGVDDGSTERLLVGAIMSKSEEIEATAKSGAGSGGGSLGRSTPRSRSPAVSSKPELKPSQIQHMLGDCVNKIVKWHYRRSSERHTTLTALLCSDKGLVFCLENVFILGFKSARMFMGKHYLWDYFVRVKEQFEMELLEEVAGNRTGSLDRNHQEIVAVWRCYCHLIDEITQSSKTLGKDGKFQQFICVSVREHLLHRMLLPMSVCKVTLEMYEENSFLRNRGLLTFLRQILLPLDDLDVVLEKSVSYGISSPSSHV